MKAIKLSPKQIEILYGKGVAVTDNRGNRMVEDEKHRDISELENRPYKCIHYSATSQLTVNKY